MFMFHRFLNLLTMMYNENEELTVCHFVRPKDRERMKKKQSEEEHPAATEEDDVTQP